MRLPLFSLSTFGFILGTLVSPLFAVLPPAESIGSTAPAEHVVLIVWDGLRPDLVSQTNTPVLYELARQGVFFRNNHPVYPSTTEVNGAALMTGDFPDHTTILGNKEYRPAIDPFGPVSTEAQSTVRKGDQTTDGHYIAVPTLSEVIQQLGFPTLAAGTKGVALFADRSLSRASTAASGSADIAMGSTLPESLLPKLAAALGPFPATITFPNFAQDTWTTRALTEELWKDRVPKLSILWLSDPDYSQHQSAPGADLGLRALKASDLNLGRVLDTLDKKNLTATTDVIVVSDHGFSTLERVIDVEAALEAHGFPASRRFTGTPPSGSILVVGLGGSLFFYVIGHDRAVIQRLVTFLQQSDYAGVLFTADQLPGTFALNSVRLQTPQAPDVVMAFRWNAELNRYGVPGRITGDIGRDPGQGMHGTLSRFDMHNTLIARGPDFKSRWVDETPTGNIDVAPTIMAILGIENPPPMDGRVLYEALRRPPPGVPPINIDEQKLTASAPISGGTWNQYLVIKKVNGTPYFEEGNGSGGQ